MGHPGPHHTCAQEQRGPEGAAGGLSLGVARGGGPLLPQEDVRTRWKNSRGWQGSETHSLKGSGASSVQLPGELASWGTVPTVGSYLAGARLRVRPLEASEAAGYQGGT